MRSFLGTGKQTSLVTIEGDMGWLPVQIRHRIEMLRLWFRLCSLPDDRLTKCIFLYDYKQSCRRKNNWCSSIKSILEDCDMEYFFRNIDLCANLSPIAVKTVLGDAKKTLWRKYKYNFWAPEIARQPKLRTYRKFKTTFKTEDYVKLNLSRANRSMLSRMRNGTYPLNIELGRYRNLPVEKRLCINCNTGAVESEIHFLCECNNYKELRNNLYSKIENILEITLNTMDNDNIMIMLLNCPLIAKYVCTYIYEATMLRNMRHLN